MLKILATVLFTLFAVPAFAAMLDGQKPSENVIVIDNGCPQGTAADALLQARAAGYTTLTLKEESVEKFQKAINANLKHNGKPAQELDGAALVELNDRYIMAYQFNKGCVVHSVMAPIELIGGALIKMNILPDDWE